MTKKTPEPEETPAEAAALPGDAEASTEARTDSGTALGNEPSTEADAHPAPAPAYASASAEQPAILVRGHDALLGGVAAAVSRRLGIDPVLLRILLVVGLLFDGVTFTWYLLAWALSVHYSAIPFQRFPRVRTERVLVAATVTLAALWIITSVRSFGEVIAFGILATVVYALSNARGSSVPASPAAPASQWAAPAAQQQAAGHYPETAQYAVQPSAQASTQASAVPPSAPMYAPRRRMSVGAIVAIVVAIFMVPVLLIAGIITAAVVSYNESGRSGVSAQWNWGRDSVGDFAWTPRSFEEAEEFSLTIGEANLDLTQLPYAELTGQHVVKVRAAVAEVSVVVPEDVRLLVRPMSQVGSMSVESSDGRTMTADWAWQGNPETPMQFGATDGPEVLLIVDGAVTDLQILQVDQDLQLDTDTQESAEDSETTNAEAPADGETSQND